MNFAALQTELAARGLDYLATRGAAYINLARAQLDASYPWPYRKTSATGTASAGTVTAADLGAAYVVQDITSSPFTTLEPWSDIDLLQNYGDIALTGSPFSYYITRTGTSGTINAFPVGGTIRAYYYMTTPDLSGPTDTPLAPTAYHGLIVDMAVQMAYRDSDDHALAQQLQSWIDRQQAQMVNDLFGDQPSTSAQTLSFASEDW